MTTLVKFFRVKKLLDVYEMYENQFTVMQSWKGVELYLLSLIKTKTKQKNKRLNS